MLGFELETIVHKLKKTHNKPSFSCLFLDFLEKMVTLKFLVRV